MAEFTHYYWYAYYLQVRIIQLHGCIVKWPISFCLRKECIGEWWSVYLFHIAMQYVIYLVIVDIYRESRWFVPWQRTFEVVNLSLNEAYNFEQVSGEALGGGWGIAPDMSIMYHK